MSDISSAYINALLSDAAYVDVTISMNSGDLQRALTDRMTPALAAYISENFEIASAVKAFGRY